MITFLTCQKNLLTSPIFQMGFAHLFHINIYNQGIDSILNNRPPNYCSSTQKCKQLYLIMFRVLIRGLISLWITKPVHPLPTRHWCLAVLCKLNMSKIKTPWTRWNSSSSCKPSSFLLFPLSDCYPHHPEAPPDTEIQPPSHVVRADSCG